MSKPSKGVCGSCGQAVVQPLEPKPGWCAPPGSGAARKEGMSFLTMGFDDDVLFGHFYEADLKLAKVQCEACGRRRFNHFWVYPS